MATGKAKATQVPSGASHQADLTVKADIRFLNQLSVQGLPPNMHCKLRGSCCYVRYRDDLTSHCKATHSIVTILRHLQKVQPLTVLAVW